MKIWMKYAIGVVLGIVCAFIFKFDSPSSLERLSFVAEIFIRIGRYCVVPLVSITTSVTFFKLIQEKLLLKTTLWTAVVVVASSILLTIAGLLAIMIVRLPRIPITVERTADIATLGLGNTIRSLFPYSSFETLLNGTFLFAPFLFSALMGFIFSQDEATYRPAIQLADSFSKLFYAIAKIFSEIVSVGMIAISCMWVVQFRGVVGNESFMPIFIMLVVMLLVVALIIYPLVVYLVCNEKNPYRIIYANIAPFLAALMSGDENFVLPLVLCHTHENVGIRRRVNGMVPTLISIFARGGTGLVLVITFIVIRRSYSDLSIPFTDILWLIFMSFVFSFMLGGISSGGTFTALSVLCAMYGKGFEAGFLLLRPMAFLLGSFAASFNVLTIVFGSYIVAVKTNSATRYSISRFI